MIIPLYEAGCPHVTHPSAAKFSFEHALYYPSLDLHVLSTPPAFILSQDQTLLFNSLLQSALSLTSFFTLPFRTSLKILFSLGRLLK